jgi:NitT/TauT family transport system permease protein
MPFLDIGSLLLQTSYSVIRMFIALALAYAFAIPYGIAAARSRRGERILTPILDILQSVPILGFFPAAIFFFITFAHETWIGVEGAAIFLIFTSQAWNLAFATYESVSAIPVELEEASGALRLKGLAKLKKLYLPACVPKLVYNGMMSWAGGWYFLVAAEIIVLGSKQYKLAGIGRYLAEATYAGNYTETILGLSMLVIAILLTDILLWRPLRGYAERFRYEAVSSERASTHILFHTSGFAWLKGRLSRPSTPRAAKQLMPTARLEPIVKEMRDAVRPLGVVEQHTKLIISLFALLIISIVVITVAPLLAELPSSLSILAKDWSNPAFLSEVSLIPSALGWSLLRLLLAYLLSVAWTLPLAVKLAGGGKGFGTSIFTLQVFASLPATALFPIIILATMNLPGGLQLTSIILTMTGMQWYLLFNLIGGARSVPSDLLEASRTYRLKSWEKWRRLLLPAMLPSFVTGSITAWGGGWNALVVSEYVSFAGEPKSVLGIGALLDKVAYEQGSISLLLITIIVMSITIVVLNQLFWRRLYRIVLSRYRIDY